MELKHHIWYDIFTRMHYADLLGGEFANCYGQGRTPQDAVDSLKLRVNQLRRIRDKKVYYPQ